MTPTSEATPPANDSTRLVAPVENGGILAVPEARLWAERARARFNEVHQASDPFHPTMQPSATASAWHGRTREAALAVARTYAATFGDPWDERPDLFSVPWIVSGHQPGPFHAGVWIKSLATAKLAAKIGGVAVQVIADNDLTGMPQIGCPSGSIDGPLRVWEPFDADGPDVPFEERGVLDDTLLSSFAKRAGRHLAVLGITATLLNEFWDGVLEVHRRTHAPLGACFAASRRRLERAMGYRVIDIPLSMLCETDAFASLLVSIATQAETFAATHNRLLATFRKERHIRSRKHPFPDLHVEAGRIELPFWCWTAADPTRRAVYADPSAGRITLRAGDGETIGTLSDDKTAVFSLDSLAPWKIRPRAITTTMLLRLAYSDLFVHGLGGGLYDALTDRVIREFWGIEPPPYAVLTGTLRLPLDPRDDVAVRHRELGRLSRDMHWNPDRYLPDTLAEREPLAHSIEEKHVLQNAEPPTRAARIDRYRRLRTIGDQLRGHVTRRRQVVDEERRQLEPMLRARTILTSREYPFFFHSRTAIEGLLANVCF